MVFVFLLWTYFTPYDSPVVLLSVAGTHHLRKEARWGGVCGAGHPFPASERQGVAGPVGDGWTWAVTWPSSWSGSHGQWGQGLFLSLITCKVGGVSILREM